MRRLEVRFKEYASLKRAARDMVALERAPKRDYFSVKRYFDIEHSTYEEEAYIYQADDIVTLRPGREETQFDLFVEKALLRFNWKRLSNLFSDPVLSEKANVKEHGVILLGGDRVHMLVSLIYTSVIQVLMVLPVWALWKLTHASKFNLDLTIGVILLFSLLFSGIFILFTQANRHEVLVAAAIYCAILVVFLGNIQQSQTQKS